MAHLHDAWTYPALVDSLSFDFSTRQLGHIFNILTHLPVSNHSFIVGQENDAL